MSNKSSLTLRQRTIYDFIKDKIVNRGYGPTVREIGARIQDQVPQRRDVPPEGAGKEGADHSRVRTCRGPSSSPEPYKQNDAAVWRVGSRRAACCEAVEQHEQVDFADLFKDKNQFCLKVAGDSMIEAKIADGDYVVIRKQKLCRDRGNSGGHRAIEGAADVGSRGDGGRARPGPGWEGRPAEPDGRSARAEEAGVRRVLAEQRRGGRRGGAAARLTPP